MNRQITRIRTGQRSRNGVYLPKRSYTVRQSGIIAYLEQAWMLALEGLRAKPTMLRQRRSAKHWKRVPCACPARA